MVGLKYITPDKARYCTLCGRPLEKTKRYIGYDIETGKEAWSVWLECPRRRWPFSRHTKYERVNDVGEKLDWIELDE